MPRSSSGVPCRPPEMRATCTDTPCGAMRQNSVSIVVLIAGTSSPILPRHPYITLSLVRTAKTENGIQPQINADKYNHQGTEKKVQ